ncbi:MAG: hypothetical protein EOO38_21785 [Cytophagaceae bacterium]|nr:MAG: hypothetical protein EOO38_21785 [Cytophagaceae bacterium]
MAVAVPEVVHAAATAPVAGAAMRPLLAHAGQALAPVLPPVVVVDAPPGVSGGVVTVAAGTPASFLFVLHAAIMQAKIKGRRFAYI